jgi:hypothetical protein
MAVQPGGSTVNIIGESFEIQSVALLIATCRVNDGGGVDSASIADRRGVGCARLKPAA